MIVVMILTYLGLVYAAFRVFKIPLKPTTMTVSIFIGIILIGGILISWQGGAPVSKQTTLTRSIVEINPQLKGLVKTINFGMGDAVKKGDVVLQIDPEPFEAALALAEAQLAAAHSQVDLAKSAVAAASASIARAKADAAYAQTERDRADRLFAGGSAAISELQVEQYRSASDAANAVVEQAVAVEGQADASLAAAERNVTVAQETVRSAKFNLDRTEWIAPADGVLVNWQARENTITTALRTSAIGTFMEMSNSRVVAVLPQNLMRHVEVGDPVDVAFM